MGSELALDSLPGVPLSCDGSWCRTSRGCLGQPSCARLEVPVYFFAGRHDHNTPFELVVEWAAVLEAPHVEIVWFEDSAHMVCIEEPERFQDELVDRVLAAEAANTPRGLCGAQEPTRSRLSGAQRPADAGRANGIRRLSWTTFNFSGRALAGEALAVWRRVDRIRQGYQGYQ